jgi:hypothetical protein
LAASPPQTVAVEAIVAMSVGSLFGAMSLDSLDMFSVGSRGTSFIVTASTAASVLLQLASAASISSGGEGGGAAAAAALQQAAQRREGVAAFCARTPLLATMLGPSPRITPLDGGLMNQVFKVQPAFGSGPALLLKFAPPYCNSRPELFACQVRCTCSHTAWELLAAAAPPCSWFLHRLDPVQCATRCIQPAALAAEPGRACNSGRAAAADRRRGG